MALITFPNISQYNHYGCPTPNFRVEMAVTSQQLNLWIPCAWRMRTCAEKTQVSAPNLRRPWMRSLVRFGNLWVRLWISPFAWLEAHSVFNGRFLRASANGQRRLPKISQMPSQTSWSCCISDLTCIVQNAGRLIFRKPYRLQSDPCFWYTLCGIDKRCINRIHQNTTGWKIEVFPGFTFFRGILATLVLVELNYEYFSRVCSQYGLQICTAKSVDSCQVMLLPYISCRRRWSLQA